MKQEFMLGCNYWDSVSGTDMWKNWKPDEVEKDLISLNACGVKYLRVFPMWRDFQPVKRLYSYQGSFGEYALGEDEDNLDLNPYGIDMEMIRRFRHFADMADKNGMKLVVSIVTGWMSGRLFVPPALEGRNLINDAEALMWTEKFVKGVVSELKDIKNIVMWDLGNECNCLGLAGSRAEAYTWTAMVRNAIYCTDSTRPISSGMHSLRCDVDGQWQLCDQGLLCDFVTTHPYPSPTINGDVEPFNGMRTTILPTAQSAYYSGIAGKPCIIQESGTFSPTIGNREMSADFARVNILSGYANNIYGYLWWCGMEHLKLTKAPYSWSMMERQLGMVDVDRVPKPVGRSIESMCHVVYDLPTLQEIQREAICVLPREIDKQLVGTSSYILAKQAGFNIAIANCETSIGLSDNYIMPCAKGWQVTYRRTWDFLIDRVFNHGANLLVTYDGGHFTEFEEIFGVKSNGVYRGGSQHTAHFDFGDIAYTTSKDIMIEADSATVLARNELGNPIFTVNNFGKGKVYFLGFALESLAVSLVDGFNPEKNEPFYLIYKHFARELRDKYLVRTDCPFVGITQAMSEEGDTIVCAINYSDKPREPKLEIEQGHKVEVLYGDINVIDKCDGVILKISK